MSRRASPPDARKDLRLLNAKLERSEAYFRTLTDNVSDLIYVLEADGTIRYVSPSVRRVLGYEPAERIGQRAFDHVHPDDAVRLQAFLAEALAAGRAAVTYRYRHEDGSWRQLESAGRNLLSNDAVAGIVVISRDITERAEIENRHRSLFENMVEGFALCRMLYDGGRPCDQIFLDVNRSFEQLTGLKDVVGRKLSEVVPGITETNAIAIETFGRVVATGRSEVFESYVPALDRWFYVSTYRTGPTEFVAMFDNITERKRSEERLKRSEAEHHLQSAALNAVANAIIITDRSGLIQWVNLAFSDLTGYTSAEAIGKNPRDLVKSGRQDKAYFERLWRTILSGQTWRGEIVNRRKDGSLYTEEESVTPVRDAQGDISHFVAVKQDVTDRKRIEERLRSSETEYRGLVEHAPLGVYRSTPDGDFLTVNPALVAMLGYESSADLLRLNRARDVYVDPAVPGRLTESALQHDGTTVETLWKRKDGSHISVRVHVRPVRTQTGEIDYLDGLAEDVTEQRSLERQFFQAQRIEAVGRLAGGVAHDFNNLLTAIIGFTELLSDQLAQDDPKRADLQEIRTAADRATDLTRQLLAFSRKQVLQARVLDLNSVVLSVERMLQRLIGEDINLHIQLSEVPTTVRADPGQMEQVILNLAVNARDAMPDGGRLQIETAFVDLDDHYAALHAPLTPGPYVMLAVSDTGVGMNAEIRAHIFEPFFTTKEQGKGTGLGLATVYGIVKQSGGYIWAYSEPGHGAAFKIYLPRLDEAPERTGETPAMGLAVGGHETVLVVEDDAKVRDVVGRVLSQKGYALLMAPDGPAALAILRAHAGVIELLVTDLVMPGMTGRELARDLKAERPDVRVLFMSGYTDDAVFRHRVLEPGVHYLQKPFTSEVLARKVRQVLG